jgi:hypothetical protein
LPILPGRSKRNHTTRIFGSSISVQQDDDTYTYLEKLKTTGDGKKVVELSKAVISSRNTEHQLAKCPVKHLCTSRPAGREIVRPVCARRCLKKITNAIKKTRNYTEHDKR